MGRKKKQKTNVEMFVGYVKDFNYNDTEAQEALGGHPFKGRLYQVVKDDQFGYRVHIGAENTPSHMAGILLGETLTGNHDGKWSFDIQLVNEDNFLDFDITPEDATKLSDWLNTDNKDLKDAIEAPVKLISKDPHSGELITQYDESEEEAIEEEKNLFVELFEEQSKKEEAYEEFSDNLTKLMKKDPAFLASLIDLVNYFSTTYSDKYEAAGKVNMGKEFLLNSQSPDTAIFNSLKYLQRYCTVGFEKSQNIKDLYKAAHYILFEIQRRKRQNG